MQSTAPLPPSPCPNTTPFGILKLSFFFFSFGKLVHFYTASMGPWEYSVPEYIRKPKFEKLDVGMIHRNKRMP